MSSSPGVSRSAADRSSTSGASQAALKTSHIAYAVHAITGDPNFTDEMNDDSSESESDSGAYDAYGNDDDYQDFRDPTVLSTQRTKTVVRSVSDVDKRRSRSKRPPSRTRKPTPAPQRTVVNASLSPRGNSGTRRGRGQTLEISVSSDTDPPYQEDGSLDDDDLDPGEAPPRLKAPIPPPGHRLRHYHVKTKTTKLPAGASPPVISLPPVARTPSPRPTQKRRSSKPGHECSPPVIEPYIGTRMDWTMLPNGSLRVVVGPPYSQEQKDAEIQRKDIEEKEIKEKKEAADKAKAEAAKEEAEKGKK